MTAHSIPVAVMAGITLYVGAYHFLLYLSRRRHREDLTFAITCLVVVLYDVCCIGVYGSTSVAEGVEWQRLQVVNLALFGIAFLWFASDYTRFVSRRVRATLSSYFLFAAVFGLLDRSGLSWRADVPSIKQVSLPFEIDITYYEATPGTFVLIQSVVGLLAYVYVFWLALRLWRSGRRKRAVPLVASMTLFFAGLFNDTAVSSGLYSFVYLIEYAYLSLILFMAYSLSTELVEAAEFKEALAASEERLSITLNSIGDAVVATDREGRITRINPTAEALTGWSAAEALGRPLSEVLRLVDSDTRREAESPVDQVLREGDVVNLAERTVMIGRDGEARHIADSGAPIRNRNGEVVGVVLVFRDVTERHALEDQLQQARKMESIGRLAGGIAHDFNNMLTPILGYTTLSLKSLPDDHPVRENLLDVRDAAQEAADLTRQLLAFSRKQMLEMQVLALNEVLSEFEPILRRLIREDIEIVFRLDPSLENARADPTQIRQIVMNLALNARDAMPDGGTLTFETANASVDEDAARNHADVKPGDYVMLAVRDTGSGMEPETVRQLFEPFFTTKERGKGTGLGLATIYGIVSQHGGHVSVESDADSGTIFRIYLPRAEEVPARAAAPEGSIEELRGEETVLIVEDERKVRNLARDILAEQGYRVIAADDVEDAQRLSREFGPPIDLLLTDVVMPRMNGPELYGRIARERPGIRVLYMSGYAEYALGERGVRGKGTHFLRKPFSPRSLTETVRAALDSPAPPSR